METINKITNGMAILFMVLISFTVRAQFLSGGVVAGVSTGQVEIRHFDRGTTDESRGLDIAGFEAGGFMKFKAGPVYLKPMTLYNFQSGQVIVDGEDVSYRANKIGFPVLVGMNVVGPLSVEAGPVYNYLAGVTRHRDGATDWDFGRSGLGYRAGLAADFGPLMLNLTYEGLTYDLGDEHRTGLREPHKLIFGAGLKFGGGDKD